MATKLRALCFLWVNDRPVQKGAAFVVDDALAADLIRARKAEPADEATRKRLGPSTCSWVEAQLRARGMS